MSEDQDLVSPGTGVIDLNNIVPPPIVVDRERLKRRHLIKIPELSLVWREEWGAKEPSRPLDRMQLPQPDIVLTYTDSQFCKDDDSCAKAVRDLQDAHMAQGHPDVHWNFLVGGNGKVYEGRGFGVKGYKTEVFKEYDGTSIDIAYIAKLKKEVNEAMKFQKGQVIRFGLMEFFVRNPFNFIEDQVDGWEILKERERKLEKKKEKALAKKLKVKEQAKKEKRRSKTVGTFESARKAAMKAKGILPNDD